MQQRELLCQEGHKRSLLQQQKRRCCLLFFTSYPTRQKQQEELASLCAFVAIFVPTPLVFCLLPLAPSNTGVPPFSLILKMPPQPLFLRIQGSAEIAKKIDRLFSRAAGTKNREKQKQNKTQTVQYAQECSTKKLACRCFSLPGIHLHETQGRFGPILPPRSLNREADQTNRDH